jgi:Cys-tRNA(Pro)/Cys-tRNA(Cys) deacylase
MSTRAIKYLEKLGVIFKVVHYPHLEKGAVFAARQTGFPLERTVKTLVADIGDKQYALALLPGHLTLDLKCLAAACKVKRAQMADIKTAERLTGYHVGGISPFATLRSFLVVMDDSIYDDGELLINAGQRGVLLQMRSQEIQRATNANVCSIGVPA